MSKARSREAVERELREAGVPFEVADAGKHFKILFTRQDGRKFQVVVPRTDSDRRGPLNARALARRILKGGEK